MSMMSNLHQQIRDMAFDLGDDMGHEWATVFAIAEELDVPLGTVESVLDHQDEEFDFEYA